MYARILNGDVFLEWFATPERMQNEGCERSNKH